MEQTKRPVRGRPFVKGDPRINAGGKSHEALSFAKRFAEAIASGGDPVALAALIWQRAMRGQPWAIEILLDRAVGKPQENGGQAIPLKLTVEHVQVQG